MKIERTYIFNIDKYVEVEGDCNKCKDGFEILYNYINKDKQHSSAVILINFPKSDSVQLLLGNDVLSMFTFNKPFATILFDNTNEFNNFVTPEWLKEFKYVE